MNGHDEIRVQHNGPIATVVFNRPKIRNAISLNMWGEIARVTNDLAREPSVRAVVYRGSGMEAFASGADISEFKEVRKDPETALRYNAQTFAACEAIRGCAKPTVAMIFGYCMGGGMAIAIACDLRFAAEGAKFGIPAARLGIIYGANGVSQLVSLVGPAYSKDILFSARTIGDVEALQIGLIQRLLPPDQLESYTYEYLGKSPPTPRCPCVVRNSQWRPASRVSPLSAANACRRWQRKQPGVKTIGRERRPFSKRGSRSLRAM